MSIHSGDIKVKDRLRRT